MNQAVPLAHRTQIRKRTLTETAELGHSQQRQKETTNRLLAYEKQRSNQDVFERNEIDAQGKALFMLKELEEESNRLNEIHCIITDQMSKLQVEERALHRQLEFYENILRDSESINIIPTVGTDAHNNVVGVDVGVDTVASSQALLIPSENALTCISRESLLTSSSLMHNDTEELHHFNMYDHAKDQYGLSSGTEVLGAPAGRLYGTMIDGTSYESLPGATIPQSLSVTASVTTLLNTAASPENGAYLSSEDEDMDDVEKLRSILGKGYSAEESFHST
jgi:hypothetical protein